MASPNSKFSQQRSGGSIASPEMLEFDPFQVDLRGERLWRREQPVKLRFKTWQVLRLLVERPDELVHTDEFLDSVWSGAAVTPGTLTQSIAELRRVLGDDASQPRFIETVHHRGYRFIAEVKSPPSPKSPPEPDVVSLPPSPTPAVQDLADDGWLVGRDAELDQLDRLMQEIRAGHRRIVFVTGEAGIGKTSLVRTFLKRLLSNKTDVHPWITGGRCIELIGEGETYLPVLEALERLAQPAEATRVRTILRKRAPSWLGQMPWVTKPAGRASPSLVPDATPNRMLREFCYAAEALAAERTLVLWFEDMHWADSATIDLLAALASRPEPCRLCIIVTYRPAIAAINAHPVAPLKRDLVQRQVGVELPLELLDKTAVRSYLEWRSAPGFEPPLVELIHEQTEGNPLFIDILANHLLAEGLVQQASAQSTWKSNQPLETVRTWVPQNFASLVELQLAHLDAEALSTLEAASVEGVTFGARAVAAATDRDVESVERTLRVLAGRGRFLTPLGEEWWSDGSVGERFRFFHTCCRDVLYRRQTATQRRRSHRLIAARLEQGFRNQPGPMAAKLALHFERGGDPEGAVRYLITAAAGVRQRAGDRQAVAYFERAFELLARLPDPDSEENKRQELDLRMHLWKELNGSDLFSHAEQDASLDRALALCDQLGDSQSRAYVSSYRTDSLPH